MDVKLYIQLTDFQIFSANVRACPLRVYLFLIYVRLDHTISIALSHHSPSLLKFCVQYDFFRRDNVVKRQQQGVF